MQRTWWKLFQQRNVSHIVFNSPHPQLTNCLVTYPDVVTDEVIETAKNYAHILREVCKRIYCPFISELSSDIHCIITDASLKFGLQPGVDAFVQQQFQEQFTNFLVRLNQGLDRCFARMDVAIANTYIISQNQWYRYNPFCLYRKYVSISSCLACCPWSI